MTAIGIAGVTGRMGKALVAAVLEQDDLRLAGGSVREGSPLAGTSIPGPDGTSTGLYALDDANALFAASDVVIDFTSPEATRNHLHLAMETGTALVLGTTGLGDDVDADILAASHKCPLLRAANFSLGVTVLMALVKRAAQALGPSFDIEILEMHHHHKVDAPSGTALALGEVAAKARGVRLSDVSDAVRDGHTGPRRADAIGFATLRGGDVAGEHSVIFAGMGERLELSHRASDRAIFARGAVTAAKWLKNQTAGLYTMSDCLGLDT